MKTIVYYDCLKYIVPNAPLVLIPYTRRDAIKSPTTICHHPQNIILCICTRPPQLYAQATSFLGYPVLSHDNTDKIGSWSDNSINAWNLGIPMEHDQDFNMYSKHTRSEIIIKTLFFKHKYLTSPIVVT